MHSIDEHLHVCVFCACVFTFNSELPLEPFNKEAKYSMFFMIFHNFQGKKVNDSFYKFFFSLFLKQK